MTPEHFPEANIKEMKKPNGWKDEDCGTIPVWHGMQNLPSGAQYPAFVSFWRPDADDLAALNSGGGIYLLIVSNGLPPVSMSTTPPFVSSNANGAKKD